MPNKITAGLLAIFLGGLGAHYFYMGKFNIAIVWLLAFIFLFWTGIVPIVLCIISFLQGITYFSYTQENWEKFINKK